MSTNENYQPPMHLVELAKKLGVDLDKQLEAIKRGKEWEELIRLRCLLEQSMYPPENDQIEEPPDVGERVVGGSPEWVDQVLDTSLEIWEMPASDRHMCEAMATLHQKLDRLFSFFEGFENVLQVRDQVDLCADCHVAKGATEHMTGMPVAGVDVADVDAADGFSAFRVRAHRGDGLVHGDSLPDVVVGGTAILQACESPPVFQEPPAETDERGAV